MIRDIFDGVPHPFQGSRVHTHTIPRPGTHGPPVCAAGAFSARPAASSSHYEII